MSQARLAPPWYVHPAEDPQAWEELAHLEPRPSFVVVNVHDGPGDEDDPWYPEAVARLRSVRVLGYVDVDYGHRPAAAVLEDVRAWVHRYRVGGVMFDRFPSDVAGAVHLQPCVQRVREAGAGLVVGNPGVVPHPAHLALLDVTGVFEGDAAAYAAHQPPAWLARMPRRKVWHLVYGCPPEQIAATTARAGELGAGHAFVTDRTVPHPWGGFPAARPGARALL